MSINLVEAASVGWSYKDFGLSVSPASASLCSRTLPVDRFAGVCAHTRYGYIGSKDKNHCAMIAPCFERGELVPKLADTCQTNDSLLLQDDAQVLFFVGFCFVFFIFFSVIP